MPSSRISTPASGYPPRLWRSGPLSRLSRLLKRALRLRRRLAPARFDPAMLPDDIKDLLLVPREKRHALTDARLLTAPDQTIAARQPA